MMESLMSKMQERKAKNAGKPKNYTLHIVGGVVVVALVITALLCWFPL